MKAVDFEIVGLRDDVLHEAVEQLHAGLDLRVRVGRELEEAVEDVVEVRHACGARDLCDVIQRLAAIVAHPRVLIGEGGEDGLEELRELRRDVLPHADRRARESVERALSRIRLRRLGQLMHLHNQRTDLLKVAGIAVLAHEVLHL